MSERGVTSGAASGRSSSSSSTGGGAAGSAKSPQPSTNTTNGTAPAMDSKYKALASEYTKMRGQLTVLKRAVIDEQAKSADLEDQLRQREVTIRKSEAEMDSVVFRNQQLARRVEVLMQAEQTKNNQKTTSRKLLPGAGSSGDKKSSEGPASAAAAANESLNSVMGEELQLKITENARLHAELDGVDARYASKISELESKISELQSTASKKAKSEKSEDSRLKDMLQGMKIENSDLSSRLTELEKEVVDKNDRITLLQVQLESTTSAFQSKDAFNSQDALESPKDPEPSKGENGHVRTVELLSQLGENVQDIVAAFSDFHTYWQHRLKDTSVGGRGLTDSNSRLSDLLLQNVRHLKPIEQSYQDALSDLLSFKYSGGEELLKVGFGPFAGHLSAYVKYAVEDVESLMIVSIQQESNASKCSPTQQAKNGQLQSEIRAFNRVLERLSEHIEGLVSLNSQKSATDTFENIVVAVCELGEQARELFGVFKSKSDHESELPTVSSQLRNTNKCIVNALTSLASSLQSLASNLSQNGSSVGRLINCQFECTPKAEPEAQLATPRVSEGSESEEKEPTPSHQANIEATTARLGEKVSNLESELSGLSDRLKKAEQSREHWKLECQLIQMKHDKLKVIQQQEGGSSGETDAKEPGVEDDVESKTDCDVLKSRIEALVVEKLESDSKAAHFYLECSGLVRLARARQREAQAAKAKLRQAKDTIRNLQGDVDSTSTNYESQLQVMTEHVANMNERLAQQTDEIERLKFELKRKK